MASRVRARISDLFGRGIYAGAPDRFRCIFVHVPKTAGLSIANALFGASCGHIPYFEFQRANPTKFARYFKFAFVRNPWDRQVSSYFFLRNGGVNELDRKWAEVNMAPYFDFEEFVREWVTTENVGRSFPHFRPQHFFLVDKSGRVMVDFVGRFEALADDFQEVAQRLSLDRVLLRENASTHGAYQSHYTAETREIVSRVYARDIALFGYQF